MLRFKRTFVTTFHDAMLTIIIVDSFTLTPPRHGAFRRYVTLMFCHMLTTPIRRRALHAADIFSYG